MNCQRCKSERIVKINGKCSDMFTAEIGGKEYGPDYVPSDIGCGGWGGDYIEMQYCLDCGQIQGTFPLKKAKMEK